MPRGVPRSRPVEVQDAQLSEPDLNEQDQAAAEADTILPESADPGPGLPVPDEQLTPEQKRIRDLEDMLARERGSKDPVQELADLPSPDADGTILIHFLVDGVSALGQIWYRGQELEFVPGSPAYQDTCDRRGWSWLELRDNDFAQVERWGEVKFRSGPWPGKTLLDAAKVTFEAVKGPDGKTVPPPSKAELEAAAKAEARRRRAAPRLPAR